MNSVFLFSYRSFTNYCVVPMADIQVLSCNAGRIDQALARQWIEVALGTHPAVNVTANYIWVLMWVLILFQWFFHEHLWGSGAAFIKASWTHGPTIMFMPFTRTGMCTRWCISTQIQKVPTMGKRWGNLGGGLGIHWTCRWSVSILGMWYFFQKMSYFLINIISRWLSGDT